MHQIEKLAVSKPELLLLIGASTGGSSRVKGHTPRQVHAMKPPTSLRRLLSFALVFFALAGALLAAQASEPLFPDVLAAKVRASGANTFDFDVTVSSPYDTPARYADGFRVTDQAGMVLGERKLWHDHQSEQPFTRDLYAVKIAPGLKTVTVQARDQRSGYGGKAIEVRLPGR